jgi:hypothetical protein
MVEDQGASSNADLGNWTSMREIPDAHTLLTGPNRVTPAPIDPLLPRLPTDGMDWPDFERLLVRMSREVEGLRDVRLYGTSGQAQHGIDVVGRAADGSIVAMQAKRYQTFGSEDLRLAVRKYIEGELPFKLARLVIVAACQANRTEITNEMVALTATCAPLLIEFWDKSQISDMLRYRSDVVTEFFGEATASAFCLPHSYYVEPPRLEDRVAIADAVLHGPAESSGAKLSIDRATALEERDPEQSAVLLLAASEALKLSGFTAQAEVLIPRLAGLYAKTGRAAEGAQMLSNHFWKNIAQGDDNLAQLTATKLTDMLTGLPAPGSGDETDYSSGSSFVFELANICSIALDVVLNPHGDLPQQAVDLLGASGNCLSERGRLAVLICETARADDAHEWIDGNRDSLESVLAQLPPGDQLLRTRLRILLAEQDGDWHELIQDARLRRLPRTHRALIFARRGRFLAQTGNFDESDPDWADAVEHACLLGYYEDAAHWLRSRWLLRTRYLGSFQGLEEVHAVATGLMENSGSASLLPRKRSAREIGLSHVAKGELRPAVFAFRRYLRDAISSSSWQEETDARELLASVYAEAGDLPLAAKQYLLAGAVDDAKKIADALGDDYVDVYAYCARGPYWTRASAFGFSGVQADLTPTHNVRRVAAEALDVLRQSKAGSLQDTRLYGPSVYRMALECLSEFAPRLDLDQRSDLLAHLEELVGPPGQLLVHK